MKIDKVMKRNAAMAKNYWKVVCRYGHVGVSKEVSVSRYLKTNGDCNLIDVLEIISKMPGVKRGNSLLNPIVKAEAINEEVDKRVVKKEKQNMYLQRLKGLND